MGRFAHTHRSSAGSARLSGFERLEERDQPATSLLANLNATGSPAFLPFSIADAPAGAPLGGKVYFLAADGTSNPALYSSDGTATGTSLVRGLAAGTSSPLLAGWDAFAANTPPVVAAGGKLYFAAPGSPSGAWVSDGTAAGTAPLAVSGATGNASPDLLVAGGRVLFTPMVNGPGGFPVPQLVSSDGTADGTVVLTTTAGGIRSAVAAGGKVYYVTEDYSGGIGGPTDTIWQTDGTAAGTRAFATLPAGAQVWTFGADGAWLAVVGGKVYFAASAAGSGTELWVSDGTPAGTRQVKEINPSTQNGFDSTFPYPRSSFPQGFTVVGGTVYFAADDGAHGQELWKTDGTAAGTVMVKDLSPSVGSPGYELTGTPSGSRLSGLTAFAGRLYFAADDGTTGQQLYVSDGTAAGTTRLTSAAHSANTGESFLSAGETPVVVAALGHRLLFGMGDAARGRQLWATDGTPAGTAVVKPIGAQASAWDRAFAGPLPVGVVGGRLLFSADDGTSGRQLWATDGTAAGTALLARLNPTDLGSDPQSFLTIGTRVLFTATDGHGAYSVYATDGTAAPVAVKRFELSADLNAVTRPGPLVRSGGLAYFTLNSGSNGRQLWATDGTPAGTRLLKEVKLPSDLAAATTNPLGIANPTDVNGKLFFTVDLPGAGQQLWATDGTPAGTKLVKQVHPQSSARLTSPIGPDPVRQLTAAGGKLFFVADGGSVGSQVWVSDGTAAGTKAVSAIPAGTFLSPTTPNDLTALNGKVYFTATDDTGGRRLWVTDGTTAGTTVVSPARPLDQPQYPTVFMGLPAGMAATSNKLFVVKSDGQLWATDGTATGEVQLTRFSFGFGPPASIGLLTAVGAKMYFAATDSTGRQLWVSDGTAAGTRVVKALGLPATPTSPYPAGGSPAVVAVVGDRLLFAADDGVRGRELWVTDGTAAGTKLAVELNPGAGGGLGEAPTAAVANGRLVLPVFSPAHGTEPWAIPLADLGLATPPPPPAPGGAGVVQVFAVTAPAGVAFRGNLATVTLPDGPKYAVTIVWGDGSTSAGVLTRLTATGKAYTISGTHTYLASATRPVTIRVTADGRTVLTPQTTATVTDARFYAGRVAERVRVGQPFSGPVATIQDLNLSGGRTSDFTATIDWGDGAKSTGTIRRTADGRYEVVGVHTFASSGKRTVSVTITSAVTGKTATAASVFQVDALRPAGV
jgi:ELWxxDGT repeat protein